MGCLLIKEAMFANCILFATFYSMGTLVRRKKTWRYSARKILEFGLLMRDIPVYVSCKFEMYIIKIALVISENIRIAFLYVLSILLCRYHNKTTALERSVMNYWGGGGAKTSFTAVSSPSVFEVVQNI